MKEYRISKLTSQLKKILKKEDVEIVEEVFKRKKSWLLYSEKPLDNLLKEHNLEFELNDVDSTGWETNWRNFLSDGWLTDTVYYCFEDKVFDDGRTVLQINPALAFGTGGHGTTKVAARLLENVVTGKKVFDVGTGSGILAILSALKGAKYVYACDIDPVAIPNTKENIFLNKIENIFLWAGTIESLDRSVKPDVVVANIITSVLTPLHPEILKLQPEYIVYSGILIKEYDAFIKKIDLNLYEADATLSIDEWCGVRLKRK